MYKKKATTKVSKTVKSYVKKTLASGIENKYIDAVYSSYQPTYSYGFISFLAFPGTQGPGISQRIGNAIKPTKISFRGQYYGGNTHILRMIVFRWHPNTAPTGALVLENVYASTFRAPFTPYNYENRGMYTILKDKTYNLSAGGPNNVLINFDLKGKKLAQVKWDQAGANVSNGVYVIMIQDGVVTLNTVDMVVRTWYEDA